MLLRIIYFYKFTDVSEVIITFAIKDRDIKSLWKVGQSLPQYRTKRRRRLFRENLKSRQVIFRFDTYAKN